MMGWVILLLVAVIAGAVLIVIGFPARLWTIAATALTLGATGYAWQGMPGLEGHPVSQADKTGELDPDEVLLRNAMFGEFNFARQYFAPADAFTRDGKYDLAVTVMQAGTIKSPGDASLWTGLGTAFSNHDRGVSPASRFAFDRAMKLWPQHPGPPFFLGLAYVRMGALAEARPFWARAVALTPEDVGYRQVLMAQLDWLDRRIAEQAARQKQMLAEPPAE
ncbi:cytochrome c biogenesis factor-like protein [Sphingomonas sp. LB-2]|uniref:tetratricopeptide repeat protein n=1 Tax=Sphingomonas caeni TaxID=2984949 RepID=UPI0022328B17|nr:cytochrome c biogenesis factor-like protein [Sphingomonas caeni]MCW3848414.1 cytochrome c biogenesis factor-like protein [Sphingomonas caeni]